jgi:hypothetical protein
MAETRLRQLTDGRLDLDRLRAERIARSARFNNDPVGIYDELEGEVGLERARQIWVSACISFDLAHQAERVEAQHG